MQRIGPLAPGAVRDRWGPFVEPATIAADLRAGVDARLADLDRAEGRMRYDELDRIAAAERTGTRPTWTASWSGRSAPGPAAGTAASTRTRWSSAGTSCARRGRSARPDAAADRRRSWPPATGRCPRWRTWSAPGGTPAEQRRRLAAARRELVAARGDVEPALRCRLRLVAATTRGAYLRGLPRADFDVVVIAGTALPPEAYYLAGLSTRSVIAIGDSGPGRAPEPYRRPAPHLEEPPRRRPGLGRSGRVHPVRPRQTARLVGRVLRVRLLAELLPGVLGHVDAEVLRRPP